MRHLGSKAEGLTGTLLMVGGLMAGGGIMLGLVFLIAGVFHGTATRNPVTGDVTSIGAAGFAPFAFTIAGIGMLVFVGGLGYGFYQEYRGTGGQYRTIPRVKVIARYGFGPNGNMLSDWEVEGMSDAKAYVKLDLGQGTMQEFECPREVYFMAGEGMIGSAEVQGRWLGRFVPEIGQTLVNRPGTIEGL